MKDPDAPAPERRPRRLEAWRFYDERAASYRPTVTPEGKFVLDRWEMSAAQFFTGALRGARSVVDVGCGAGFPSLLIASEVGHITATDVSIHMVSVAAKRASLLKCNNIEFCVSFGQQLPFRANLFDGAILCASLQSTAEPEAMVSEVRRALAPGGRIACLERHWQGEQGRPTGPVVLKRFYLAHGELFHQLFYQFSERLPIPGRERNYRYRIDPESDFGRMILANQQLLEQHALPTRMDPDELPLESITAAWFDESSGFTPETLTELFERAGFSDIHLEVATLWSREEQMLLTCRLPE
jgi:ubiquinone/menaquinone biosynthesis C-methylase UbiE